MQQLEPSLGMAAPSAVSIKNLRVHFYTRRGIYKALNGANLVLREGEVLGIAGESGSGKSTLGLTVMGLLPRNASVPAGQVILERQDLVGLQRAYAERAGENFRPKRNEKILRRLNRAMVNVRGTKLAMVFQEPMTSLNPVLTTGFQIAETVYIHDPKSLAMRVLARSKATRENMREVIQILQQGFGIEPALAAYVKKNGIQGIGEQVLFIWRRTDIHVAKKEQAILSIAGVKLTGIQRRFLEQIASGGTASQLYRYTPVLRKIARRVLLKEGSRKAEEILTTLGVPHPERVVKMYPHELSGGMRQRVVIAIALVNNPKVIIMDEPTSAVDVTVQAQILELVKQIRTSVRASFIFISHDVSVLSEVCDRIAIMYAGKIVELGPMDTMLKAPLHPYTQMLMAAIPTLEGKDLQGIKGEIPDLRDPPAGCSFHPRCPFAFEKCKQKVPPDLVRPGDQTVACWLYEAT